MAEPVQPLLPMVQADTASEELQRVFRAATVGNYQDPNILRVVAHDPALLRHLLDFSKYCLYEGEVEHRLIELVRIKLAQLNDCHF